MLLEAAVFNFITWCSLQNIVIIPLEQTDLKAYSQFSLFSDMIWISSENNYFQFLFRIVSGLPIEVYKNTLKWLRPHMSHLPFKWLSASWKLNPNTFHGGLSSRVVFTTNLFNTKTQSAWTIYVTTIIQVKRNEIIPNTKRTQNNVSESPCLPTLSFPCPNNLLWINKSLCQCDVYWQGLARDTYPLQELSEIQP